MAGWSAVEVDDQGIVRRRVVVSGRVQGVWFRDTCQQEARRRGVTGWVRNRDDLTVEAAFEGPAPAVAELLAWCHEGPPRAEVAGVEVREEAPAGDPTFEVLW